MAGEAASYGVIGRGTIGAEVVRQVGNAHERLQLRTLPHFVLSNREGEMVPDLDRDGAPQFDSMGQLKLRSTGRGWDDIVQDRMADVLFVAMPSTDDGVEEYNYARDALSDEVDVITAAKGAMASFYAPLRDQSEGFSNLGHNATVGGGTRMIRKLQEHCIDPANVQEIHVALNGTLTYIYSGVGPLASRGRALGEVVHEARLLGYADPLKPGQVVTDYDVVRSEALGDVPKKTAILFNSLGLSEKVLRYSDLDFKLENDEIARSLREAKSRRMIVSILPDGSDKDHDDIIGRYDYTHDGWKIVMGFAHIDRNPLYSDLAQLTGAGNGFVIGEGPGNTDGQYSLTGPGAGPRPTVNTMLNDRLHMLRARKPRTRHIPRRQHGQDWVVQRSTSRTAATHRHPRTPLPDID